VDNNLDIQPAVEILLTSSPSHPPPPSFTPFLCLFFILAKHRYFFFLLKKNLALPYVPSFPLLCLTFIFLLLLSYIYRKSYAFFFQSSPNNLSVIFRLLVSHFSIIFQTLLLTRYCLAIFQDFLVIFQLFYSPLSIIVKYFFSVLFQ
jgi:hypothetical protein